MKKRICFLYSSLDQVGGITKVLSQLIDKLSNDYEVYILSLFKSNRKEIYEIPENIKFIYLDKSYNSNLKIKFLKLLLLLFNGKNNILSKKYIENLYSVELRDQLIQVLKDYKIETLVSVHGFNILLGGMIKEKLKNNLKVIGWNHTSYDFYFKTKFKNFWRLKYLYKKYAKELDCNIVLSDYDKKIFQKELEFNHTCIYNYFSMTQNIEKEINKSEKINIIAISRLSKEKGIDLLLKTMLIIQKNKKILNYNLKIIGDGLEKNKYKKFIEKNNLSNIKLVGEKKNVNEFYNNADLILFPSKREGFPMVLLEAINFEVPFIAFDIPIFKEIYAKFNIGNLVNAFNTKLFAKKIEEIILKKNQLENERKKMKNLKQKFDIEKGIAQWKKIL